MGSPEPEDNSKVKSTVDAVKGLVESVPVYQDAIQPAAKQVGQSLETIAKTVNIVLAPIKVAVWGYERIEEFIINTIPQKLKNVPEENITTPPIEVAGPAIEALRFTGDKKNLRELYANLLATAMNKDTIHKAHPGYVEIIKNITPDEAVVLNHLAKTGDFPLVDVLGNSKSFELGYRVLFKNYSHLHKKTEIKRPDLIPTYIDNLSRLGVLDIPAGLSLAANHTYEPLENDKDLDEIKNEIENSIHFIGYSFKRKVGVLTSFGTQFVENVVLDYDV
ncbi:DUF4393 domain-containing protein [Gracilimonas tropica]|uniref:DUF4393 domain-containing protein n=1 Tax=Gracilimonas tropica TaxID=454600 RepID=UPI0003787F2F|nr:DUF4393 domain-containing protein [Gracilimonas tropica]